MGAGYYRGMSNLARIPQPTLAAGLLFFLAPLSLAQLGQTQRLAGSLDPSEDPRFYDFTGNGLLDVLVLSQESPGDLVLELVPAISSVEYGLPERLLEVSGDLQRSTYLTADIDGDGDTDIWHATRTGPIIFDPFEITSYLNDGQGNLSVGMTLAGIPADPDSLESIDVDGDGLLDLRVSTGVARDGYFQRQPGGSFGAYQQFFTSGHGHGHLKFGDVDGDGDPDLVAGNAAVPGSSQMQVVLYANTGSFPIDPSTGIPVTSSAGGAQIALSDLDADGDEDLLVAKSTFPTEAILFESLGGTFQDLGAVLPSASPLRGIELTDMDGDGDDDILFGRSFSDLLWAENLGGLAFAAELLLSTKLSIPSDTADLDGDGLKELLLFRSSFEGTMLWIRATELQGGAVALGSLEIPLTDFPGRDDPLVSADLNGDGLDDLVFVWSPPPGFGPFDDTNQLGWKRALGTGEFALTVPIAGIGSDSFQVHPLTGDFDGDGNADVLYIDNASSRIRVLRGDGNGCFPGPVVSTPSPFQIIRATTADLNADSTPDLLLQSFNGLSVASALGTPSGVFVFAGTSTGATPLLDEVVPVDVNGDGRDDLLFTASPHIELALQTQTGDFTPRTIVADASGLSSAFDLVSPSGFDVNEDGIMDILVPVGSTLQWARGFGDGTFDALQVLTEGSGPNLRRVFATRVDQDGKQDLVQRSGGSGSPHWWARNLGGGSFSLFEQASGTNLPGTGFLLLSDTDGDGDKDLLSGTFNGHLAFTENLANEALGTNYCGPGVPNSTGQPGQLSAFGTPDLAVNALSIRAFDLPANQFGFFLVAPTQGLVTSVPNSQGTLCLGGAIGRFDQPSEIQFSGEIGVFNLTVDLTSIPTPSGDVPVLPGETWNFQAWHRDTDGTGGATSNFTNGLEVTF